MKRFYSVPFLIFAMGSFLNLSCNYNHAHESPEASAAVQSLKVGNPDFASVQTAVIAPRCLGCHADSTGNKGSTNLETYQNLRRLMARISFRALDKMDMPPQSPLSPEEMQLLKSWLEQGAPETISDSQGPSDPTLEQGATDWQKINKMVFAKKCLDCHSQPQPQGKLDLNSYEEVKLKATLLFERIIIKQDMPVQPYPALSLKERSVLLKWMNAGMPQ